jgi:predicted nuclease with TOPRIM domain
MERVQGADERLLMVIETHRAETLAKLNEMFRMRTQKIEELEELEVQLQVGRGIMQGLEQCQNEIQELAKTRRVEEERRKNTEKADSELEQRRAELQKQFEDAQAKGATENAS